MKVLWLGNSDDVGLGSGGPRTRSIEIAQQLLEDDLGEQIEIIGRVIWPSPNLADLIGEWIERYEPDVVMFKINGYWYLYPSVPLRLQRALGSVVGGSIAAAGRKTAEFHWLAHTRPYHALRRLARRTVGAATYFSPEEIAELAERCVRRVLQHEHVGLVVWSPLGGWEGAPPGAAEHVYTALEALCGKLGVLHVAWQPGTPDPSIHLFQTGDRVHRSDEGHYWYGIREARAVKAALQAARTGDPVEPVSI